MNTVRERVRGWLPSLHRGGVETQFVTLDRHVCEACWECVEACPNAVLGRIEIGPHRHAIVRSPDDCTGCLACVKGCEAGALVRRAAG